MRETVAVIAAHADDDVLGCGGTIAKLRQNGANIVTMFFTDGVGSRLPNSDLDNVSSAKTRNESMKVSHSILGMQNHACLAYPDNQLDTVPLLTLSKEVEEFLKIHNPTKVFTHTERDLNIDHQRVSQAVITACRPLSYFNVSTLLFFEVPSATNWQLSTRIGPFDPRYFVDITETIEMKIKAFEVYRGEVREYPHPRSETYLRALAQFRGAACGVNYAEAFEIGRIQI